MSFLSYLKKEYPWAVSKSEAVNHYKVEDSLVTILVKNRSSEKLALIRRLRTLSTYSYVAYTDLNEEIKEAMGGKEGQNFYFSRIEDDQLDKTLLGLYVGGWVLFFSNQAIDISNLNTDLFNCENLSTLTSNTNAQVIINSYLDDREWTLFIA